MSVKEKKKKGEKILLLPGAHGWETWTGANGGGLTLSMRTEEHLALDVDRLPAGDLAMAFPVRDVSALPFRAPTSDEALFGDMAEMHVERLGMRPGVDAGILSDYFKVGSRGDESLLLPVVLAPPPEGHLPKRSPQSFDISARCLPLPSDGVVVWRELGRWVFALSEEGQPLHFQALAATNLGEDAGREIRLTLSQLQMQGLIDGQPKHCFVWVGDEESPPAADELEGLGRGFGGTAAVAAKPAPVIPSKRSQLLPADVRAERRARRQKQQSVAMIAVLILLYVAAIGFLAFKLIDAQKKARVAENKFADLEGPVIQIQEHKKKWEELRPVTEVQHWPVELLLHVNQARPDQGLRLERCDIHNQLEIGSDGAQRLIRTIRIQGSADELAQVKTFDLNLKENDSLRDYRWTTPPASEKNGGGWSFVYDAEYRGALTQ